MAKKLTATEVSRKFSEVIARVHLRGESFLLTRHGRVVARLAPVDSPKVVRLADLPRVLADLPRLGPDEATRFEQDLEAGRHRLRPPRDPWDS
ncbi:MAG: type II toxin-antitoxin system Phd/YefM family antitoxin [Candidatus Riflebacteria bacterium]|nr:type II toxin-antitoxin system Phd/YefM family antitoxin [Candidatus Riflebacteria bacterium]